MMMKSKDIRDRLQSAMSATDMEIRAQLLEPVAACLNDGVLAEYVGKLHRYAKAKEMGDSGAARSMGQQISVKSKSGQQYLQHLSVLVAKAQEFELREEKEGVEKVVEKRPRVTVPKTRNPCLCGCGKEVGNLFAMGHDMRVRGMLRRVQSGEMSQSSLPPGVRAMLVDLVVRWGIEHSQGEDGKVLIAPKGK